MFYCTIIGTAIIVVSFILAAIYGKTIESFALAWTANEFIGTSLSYYILFVLVMRQSLWPVLRALLKPLVFSAALVLLFVLYKIIIPDSFGHLINLIGKCGIGGGCLLYYLKLTNQFDIISFVRTKFLNK